MLNLKIERVGDELRITTPIWRGKIATQPSSTGKSILLASTEGPYDLSRIWPTLFCQVTPEAGGGQGPALLDLNLYVPLKRKAHEGS